MPSKPSSGPSSRDSDESMPYDPSRDFGPNLGTILVCFAAAVMIYTAVGNPTFGALVIAGILTIAAVALVGWRLKVRNARKNSSS